MDNNRKIDITGMCCSVPIIKISKELKDMQSGDILLALSDKVSMENDIPAFCRQSGNELLGLETSGQDPKLPEGTLAFYIKKR
ncbi:MAG: sulfurtransferase TusA family protein [Deltaproteobacteria bacterium]|jgi:tRNA 2-thiouridine synthesizing protein A|nr:sulfurtransferase TusA family protein [Deltaproteobacteria bacterium]